MKNIKQETIMDGYTNEHTPGPWIHDTNFHLYKKDQYQHIVSKVGLLNANHGDGLSSIGLDLTFMGNDETAKLIASAPQLKADNEKLLAANRELIEALQGFIDNVITDKKIYDNQISYYKGQFRKAIQKHSK